MGIRPERLSTQVPAPAPLHLPRVHRPLQARPSTRPLCPAAKCGGEVTSAIPVRIARKHCTTSFSRLPVVPRPVSLAAGAHLAISSRQAHKRPILRHGTHPHAVQPPRFITSMMCPFLPHPSVVAVQAPRWGQAPLPRHRQHQKQCQVARPGGSRFPVPRTALLPRRCRAMR